MDSATTRVATPQARLFEDGLGVRRQIQHQPTETRLEMLCLNRELTVVPAFEYAVRERVSRLANFHHPSYGRVRRVERLNEQAFSLGIVSECVRGARLSEILEIAERKKLALDINAALYLVRQLTSAVSTLHQNARDVAHGAIAPERIVVTPHAQLVITDYALGSALEALQYPHERYWKAFRVAVPPSAGGPRFDHRTDVTQIGIVALSLILGRTLGPDEYPARIADLVASASVISTLGGREPVAPALRTWLARTLQIDRRGAFTSAKDVQASLDEVLADGGYVAAPVALEAFLGRYRAAVAQAPAPQPAQASPPYAKYLAGFEPVRRPASPPVTPVVPVTMAPAPAASRDATPVPGIRAIQPGKPITPVDAPRPPRPPRTVEDGTPVPPVAAMPSHRPPGAPETSETSETSETDYATDPEIVVERQPLSERWRRLAVAATILISVTGVGIVAASRYYRSPTPIGATVGTLVVESNPPGAQVLIDGEGRGVTPVTLSLRPGSHVLEIDGGGEPRVIPLIVPAGAQVSQYIELPAAGSAPGALQVRTDPPGAQIVLDGRSRGITPLTIGELKPGTHEVVLENDRGSVTETVTIEAATTASLVVPLTTAMFAPVSGWISVTAPVEVELFEHGTLLGTSAADRIMLATGVHEISFVNATLGYEQVRTVEIAAGEVSELAVELPDGLLALNASPWAEVWVDGEPVGETPIGNLPVSIGPHEVLFRHPDLGERRHAVTVTAVEPARLSIDLSLP